VSKRKKHPPLMAMGSAVLLRDEDTGKMFWQTSYGDDMDTPAHEPGEPIILNPDTFPEGTTVEICEPDYMKDERAKRFYEERGK
jgi:hypothetical protein